MQKKRRWLDWVLDQSTDETIQLPWKRSPHQKIGKKPYAARVTG